MLQFAFSFVNGNLLFVGSVSGLPRLLIVFPIPGRSRLHFKTFWPPQFFTRLRGVILFFWVSRQPLSPTLKPPSRSMVNPGTSASGRAADSASPAEQKIRTPSTSAVGWARYSLTITWAASCAAISNGLLTSFPSITYGNPLPLKMPMLQHLTRST